MQKIIQLSLTDFRQILREQLLWVMFIIAPSMQFLVAHWLAPFLIERFPVLDGYQSLIVGVLTIQVVTGIGFVIAMMLLDEKDEDVLTAVRVLPLGPEVFLAYRLLAATVVAFLFAFVMLYFSQLIMISIVQAVTAAGLFALLGPIIALFMSTFSDNKVEGLAVFKGLNLVLLVPIASFFVPEGWSYFFGLIPDFWSLQFVEAIAKEQEASWMNALIGLIVHLAVLIILFIQFKKRVFQIK